MEIFSISTISLIWFIYITLSTESDRQNADLFNRLKFSLAISNDNTIDKIQLDLFIYLGISEIFSYKDILDKTNNRYVNIQKFETYFQQIEQYKKLFILNAFLLTIFSIICSFLNEKLAVFLSLYIVLSLVGAIFFYGKILEGREIIFIGFKPEK